ncbi:MAG: hypothetical protein FJ291_17160 [Planctomycetes bacterium]|nr:hypothetical protein [Planctomycetota bacterium]
MRSGRLLVVALCAVAGGCSTPVGEYFARRGADLADCMEAEAGLGWPVAPFLFPRATGYALEPTSGKPIVERKPRWHMLLVPHVYMRAKLTDFFVLGNGYAQPVCYGWRGRYRAAGSGVPLAAGLPIYHNHEETAGTTVHTDWLVLTHRSYDATKPGPGGRLAESCWAGVSATLLLALRLELNLVELTDFLVGLSTYDLLGDDTWQRKDDKQ